MVNYTTQEVHSHSLTPEGEQIAEQGSHEARVWAAVPDKDSGTTLPISDLKNKVGDESAKVGQGRAFKNGWVGKQGDGLIRLVRTSGALRVVETD
jgi:phenylalanyl-tRNA synthetase alpha chain